ncbi:hypothetical protein [Pseudomonas cyclaminis]
MSRATGQQFLVDPRQAHAHVGLRRAGADAWAYDMLLAALRMQG